eukprot:Sspe_Gene.118888::Locus_113435_Transcript_1_1_Confidence_1.000_Length_724::g.118888::m.118888
MRMRPVVSGVPATLFISLAHVLTGDADNDNRLRVEISEQIDEHPELYREGALCHCCTVWDAHPIPTVIHAAADLYRRTILVEETGRVPLTFVPRDARGDRAEEWGREVRLHREHHPDPRGRTPCSALSSECLAKQPSEASQQPVSSPLSSLASTFLQSPLSEVPIFHQETLLGAECTTTTNTSVGPRTGSPPPTSPPDPVLYPPPRVSYVALSPQGSFL